ncbi:COG complex component [Heliocybe sulcata]|uniref:Conserved oligomeric Golgi complex subunit 2 n=1 Tax=Heliocybe sulcata TaxID=5364 RepID=A0A5C3NC24_9AGAM|nr:COG complex component [Heliocybe sulcata]
MSMSFGNAAADASKAQDPFELERLAEELAVREISDKAKELQDETGHDLPIYIPLSHDDPYLAAETFDVEEFLLSRSYTSLPDLRSELREYLATLKESLVKLINDDYEAFISLSTDLRGEGARLERLKRPLGDVKTHIVESRDELRAIQDNIEDKLQKRAVLRENKAFLHLLLKISESVTRLESLLLITLPENESSPSEGRAHGLSPLLNIPDDDARDDKIRGSRAKHLSRVASEYTQLLYHVSKAEEQRAAFLDEIRWRVDRIRSTLSSDLDHLFGTTLTALTDGKEEGNANKASEAERAKWMSDLVECLRSYDMLGLWRDAEDVLRREVVRGFVKNTVFPGSLTAPHSPLLPHTPFVQPRSPGFPNTASYFPPRTPYTPFTAFASKENPFQSLQTGNTRSSVPLLDESDNALATLYNRILRFVDRDLTKIMEAAERVSIKSGSRAKGSNLAASLAVKQAKQSTDSRKDGEAFAIMANVVWAELARAIIDELGSVVFAAGRPDEFRKNYHTTQAFIRSLEFLAPSIASVELMRNHPLFTSFERCWQLPVYYQLRWKEIIAHLEDVLSSTRIEPSPNRSEAQPFVTTQAKAIWVSIETCWSDQVYIPELAHRFWRFTLQLLSRYKTWLDSSLPTFEPLPKTKLVTSSDASGSGTPRASTPVPQGAETTSSEANAKDEELLRQLGTAITDIKTMQEQMMKIWREEISVMLPDMADVEGQEFINPEDVLDNALKSLASLITPMANQVVAILARRACEAVQAVRSIPASLRAMSLKRAPSEPSYFIPTIMQPVKSFFGIGTGEGPGSALKDVYLGPCSTQVFENAVERYIFWITSLRRTEESLRKLQKAKKPLFGRATTGRDDKGKDEERIRSQMILDVEAFGKDAASLGVVVEDVPAFQSLRGMVHASLSEG